MTDEHLSPMPTPTTQDPELYPGGVDALADDPADNGLGRDLSPEDNPAVDDAMPDEIAQPDDKSQAPEGEADDAESGTTTGSGAGQSAEDGSPEPPA